MHYAPNDTLVQSAKRHNSNPPHSPISDNVRAPPFPFLPYQPPSHHPSSTSITPIRYHKPLSLARRPCANPPPSSLPALTPPVRAATSPSSTSRPATAWTPGPSAASLPLVQQPRAACRAQPAFDPGMEACRRCRRCYGSMCIVCRFRIR